jgi:SAM-dependent methyltransferase
VGEAESAARACAQTLASYRRTRRLAAARCRIRNRIFDPTRVLRYLPDRGRVLDWGCGDGFLANLIAAFAPDLSIVGVDTSSSKLAIARGAQQSAQVSFVEGAPPTGPFEAVLLIDLLHHLPADLQARTFRQACDLVEPGGVLVLKEIDGGRPRAMLNQAHDFLVSGQWVHALPRRRWLDATTQAGLEVVDEVDCFTFGYPHYLFAARRL